MKKGGQVPNRRGSRKQPATANSTPMAEAESLAEVLSCNQTVQGEALPAQHLLELVLGRPVKVVVHEDNESTIAIAKKGYSPKLRAMQRTHKTNMEQLYELVGDQSPGNNSQTGNPCGVVVLQHHEGVTHKGDMFTKFLEPCKFT